MPPLDSAEYLLSYLWEIGPTMSGAMGASPITHTEIAAWCQLTDTTLSPSDVRMLRRLSIEYVSESHKARKYGAPPPWVPEAKALPTSAQLALRELAKL